MPILFVAILALLLLPMSDASAETGNIQADLDKKLAAVRDEAGLVGAGGVIMRDGQIVALSVAGVRRKGKANKIAEDDLWHVGSITKSMTATLIGLLVDEDVLDFGSTLPELLPELYAEMDNEWHDVTLHHLLTHTSGAPPNFPVTTQMIWPETSKQLVRERRKQIAKIISKPPKSTPGTTFSYSNIGFTIAGHIAETATGLPFEELLNQKVFSAMAVDTSGFGAPQGENPWGHAVRFGFKSAKNPENRADNTPVMSPAGAVHISLSDLAAYGQHHLDGELERDGVLKSSTYQKLHTPFLEEYAYGWVVMERDWTDGKLIWHNGSNTMWYALLLILPEKNMVMAFTTNDGDIAKAETAFFKLAKEIALSSSQSDGRTEE